MNPKQFLQISGTIFFIVGVLGMVDVLGPTSQRSIFGETWWFDNVSNTIHVILGVIGLTTTFLFSSILQKYLVLILGILCIIIGIYSVAIDTTLFGASLEIPADTLFYLLIGAWACYGVFGSKAEIRK